MASPKKKWLRMKAAENATQAARVAEVQAVETARIATENAIVAEAARVEALRVEQETQRLATLNTEVTEDTNTSRKTMRVKRPTRVSTRFVNNDEG